MSALTAVTLNIQGGQSLTKLHKILQLCKSYDILCLQETRYETKSGCSLFDNVFEQNFYIFHSFATPGNKNAGIALLISRKLESRNRSVNFELASRAISLSFAIQKSQIKIIGLYAPAQRAERPRFFDELFDRVESCDDMHDICLCLGDFNYVENIQMDRSGQAYDRQAGKAEFDKVKSFFNLTDLYRFKYPQGRQFSFLSGVHGTQSRLDRIYGNETVTEGIQTFKIANYGVSDHCLVLLKFKYDPGNEARGPSYWKLNVRLLDENVIINTLLHIIGEGGAAILREIGLPVFIAWDRLKAKIADYLKYIGRIRAKERRVEQESLAYHFNILKQNSILMPNDREIAARLRDCSARLDALTRNKVASVLHATHYKDTINDRMSIASAKALQKKSAADRIFHALRKENGEVVHKSHEILAEIRTQYGTLYTSQGIDQNAVNEFLNETLVTVTRAEKDTLDQNLSLAEIETAIKSFGNGKTPGSDGLPVELYVKYIAILAPVLKHLYETCFNIGSMSNSMHYGIISQIYKGKGDRLDRSSWRPLTMLNVDYKILAKILTNRLKVCMANLVYYDQNCAVPGRSMQDGIMSLYNIVSYMIENQEGVLLSVDHATAFDVIEWDYISQVLNRYEMGRTFLKWIDTIYSHGKVMSSVQVNGFVSKPFSISRGIRQGCPLSPLLYVLVGETFTNLVRNRLNICGIIALQHEHTVNNYADDTNFTLEDFDSAKNVMKAYDRFQLASGARLKKEKTQVLLFSPQQVPEQFVPFLKEEVTVYGVQISKSGFGTETTWEKINGFLRDLGEKIPPLEVSYYG